MVGEGLEKKSLVIGLILGGSLGAALMTLITMLVQI